MAQYSSNRDLVSVARAKIGRRKQAEWAKEIGVSAQYVNDFLRGRRDAGPALLRALGFEPTPYYRKAEK